nr:MAG TPA: hypothetical protein [Caudoviricetes sp.]DAV33633.1 MAG TPA: hypothetical protein [Bacteriophage sp.]
MHECFVRFSQEVGNFAGNCKTFYSFRHLWRRFLVKLGELSQKVATISPRSWGKQNQ